MKISQREARRLRKRVQELEDWERQRMNPWHTGWPRGVDVGSVTVDSATYAALHTARKLRHAVVVVTDELNTLKFYAIPMEKL
jgi:hypothetical protein